MNDNKRAEEVCLCKAIKLDTVKESIRKGNTTLEALSQELGAARGACKGMRCKEALYNLIKGYEKGEWQ